MPVLNYHTTRPTRGIRIVYVSTTNCNVIIDHNKCLEQAQCTSYNYCKKCTHKHCTIASACEAYVNSRPPLMSSQPSNQPNQHTRINVAEATTTPLVGTTLASNSSTPVTTALTSNSQSSVLFNLSNSVCLLKTAVTKVKSYKTSTLSFHNNLLMCCS